MSDETMWGKVLEARRERNAAFGDVSAGDILGIAVSMADDAAREAVQ